MLTLQGGLLDIPRELYKYRDFEKYSILSLLSKGLWIPKPSQLNDPFDAQLKLSNTDVSLKQFKEAFSQFKNLYLKDNNDPISLDGLFKDNKPSDLLKEKVELFCDFWEKESEKVGVLSLSEDAQSTTMWSHYADNHTGICIGYNPEKLAPKSPNGAMDWLRKVTYMEENEIIRNAYLLYAKSGMANSHKSLMEVYFKMLSTKSLDWAYEKEWRFLCPDIGGRVYNLEIDAITSVTFGLRTSIETKTAISHLLRYHKKKTQFYQAIRCDHTIGLERIGMNGSSEYWMKPYE
ncbi:hypothetical protein DS885_03985 [Psychromonas sp. B3M02]|nr:hypothetical protein DS885_03985 [Psychromonas sp. B3M02]